MENEIDNLRILVDLTAKRIVKQVNKGNLNGLTELLWYVPIEILKEFLTREQDTN